MDKKTADAMRGMVRRVTLKNVKDDGQTQTASIEVADGIFRDDIEVMQPYGFASHVPQDGALALAFAIGGDQGDMVIMPIGNPSKRMGKLNPGEVGFYNESGDRAIMTAGGSLEIKAGQMVNISTDAGVFIKCVVVAIDGDLTVSGNATVDGNINTGGNVTAGGVVTDSDGNNGA